MGIFSHIFAGAAAGGFEAMGDDIDERQKVQRQVGLLATANNMKVAYFNKDNSQAITGVEFAALPTEEQAN